MENHSSMRYLFLLTISLFFLRTGYAQVPSFDRLEMLYAQKHYKIVYRKSNLLLDNPEYDYSHIPLLYKSMSMFQLSQNEHWLIRHSRALEDASTWLKEVRNAPDGKKVFTAHVYELASLRNDLMSWAEDLKRRGKTEDLARLQLAIAGLFDEIPEMDVPANPSPHDLDTSDAKPDAFFKQRDDLVIFAKKQLGVPYVWAGEDPSGFDCSGFTSYVMKEYGKYIPRRAVDQYEASKKLKERQVQKGDLVFFNNGHGVSHVGMIISDRGQPVTMIHASSSKGISIVEIGKSTYWTTRLHGYGTFIY